MEIVDGMHNDIVELYKLIDSSRELYDIKEDSYIHVVPPKGCYIYCKRTGLMSNKELFCKKGKFYKITGEKYFESELSEIHGIGDLSFINKYFRLATIAELMLSKVLE